MNGGAIVITNLDDVLRAIGNVGSDIEQGAKIGIGRAGLAVERQAKLNANTGTHKKGEPRSGGPGPNVVTGNLRRSINTAVRYGFGTYIAIVGASMEYARAVEKGSPRWKSGVKYPYLEPAALSLIRSGQIQRIFIGSIKEKMRG